MIETIQEGTCKACGKPLIQKGGGHRKRSYCSDRCKMADSRRRRKELPQSQNVTIVPIDEQGYQARIAALEEEVATLKALAGKRMYGKLRTGLQRRLMERGKVTGYPAVTIRVPVSQGVDAWRNFAKDASEDMLARAIVAAGGS